MTDKPIKMPRFGATFFGLAMRDRALREAGLHDEADAAARRFEAVTGIDVHPENEDPDRERVRKVREKVATYFERPGSKVEKPDRAVHTNRRTRRADAAKARRRSA